MVMRLPESLRLSPYRPVPWHAGQIAGVQVCALPSQVHAGLGTRPPPWHVGQWFVRFMIAPMRVASHVVAFT